MIVVTLSQSQSLAPFLHPYPQEIASIMQHGTHHASPPLLAPSPSPRLNSTVSSNPHKMLASVFMALFLPCAGMSAVFLVYLCLLWHSSNHHRRELPGKSAGEKGLSAAELEKLPKVTGKELVMGTECAVCLDEIKEKQPARLVPGCNHGFHLHCADAWLLKHSVCPVCRAKMEPQLFHEPDLPC